MKYFIFVMAILFLHWFGECIVLKWLDNTFEYIHKDIKLLRFEVDYILEHYGVPNNDIEGGVVNDKAID